MNGTKFYKLHKSNESLLVVIEDAINKLHTDIETRISSAIISVAEIVFSALLTYILDREINFSSCIENTTGLSHAFITAAFLFVVFLLSIGCCHFFVWVFSTILRTFQDNKRRPKDIYMLKKVFYRQILNDITTGFSLEKKSYELSVGLDQSAAKEHDRELAELYLYESIFYFQEALHAMEDRYMFEPYNETRIEYTNFLEALNPLLLCNIFEVCINTLSRIENRLISYSHSSQIIRDASNVKAAFSVYLANIKKQSGIGS